MKMSALDMIIFGSSSKLKSGFNPNHFVLHVPEVSLLHSKSMGIITRTHIHQQLS